MLTAHLAHTRSAAYCTRRELFQIQRYHHWWTRVTSWMCVPMEGRKDTRATIQSRSKYISNLANPKISYENCSAFQLLSKPTWANVPACSRWWYRLWYASRSASVYTVQHTVQYRVHRDPYDFRFPFYRQNVVRSLCIHKERNTERAKAYKRAPRKEEKNENVQFENDFHLPINGLFCNRMRLHERESTTTS